MLPVPVIASVGHHTDRTLIDDVAAVSCSTPTHAAESAVPLHCDEARASLRTCAGTLTRHGRRTLESRADARVWAASLSRYGRRAVVDRARKLAALSRAPAEHLARHRVRLHQQLREMRASARRGLAEREELARTHALVVARKGRSTAVAARTTRARTLETLALALAAHDPDRTLARGYALVSDAAGGLVTTATEAAAAGDVGLRFADGRVRASVEDGIEGGPGGGDSPGGESADAVASRGGDPVRPPGEDPAP
jgi:exodeoxyribonuclease VII large subunit